MRAKITADAWNHAGFAVECAVKAAIMARLRLNVWPSRDHRAEFYTHNLHDLCKILGIQFNTRDPVAPKWQTVLLWGRSDSYYPGAMPIKVASDMIEAGCGPEGVIPWLIGRFRLPT